jgi:hypothetical protein
MRPRVLSPQGDVMLAPGYSALTVSNVPTPTVTAGTGGQTVTIRASHSNGESRDMVYAGLNSTLTPALTRTGSATGDDFGETVIGLGDVNDDGIGDWAIGAPGYSGATGSQSGAVFIVDGANPTGTFIRTIEGQSPGARLGSALAVGRFEAGRDAVLLMGAPTESVAGFTNAGSVYYTCIKTSVNACGVGLDSLRVINQSPFANRFFGTSVAYIGDVAGDGNTQVAAGMPSASLPGSVQILKWSSASLTIQQTLTGTNGNNGDSFGKSLASGQDLTGDGLIDLVIGAPNQSGGGAVYVAHRPSVSWTIDQRGVGVSGYGSHVAMWAVAVPPALMGLIVASSPSEGFGVVRAYPNEALPSTTFTYPNVSGPFTSDRDFDGDSYPDLVTTTTTGIEIVGARPTAAQVSHRSFTLPSGGGLAFLPDHNGDGRAEIAVGNLTLAGEVNIIQSQRTPLLRLPRPASFTLMGTSSVNATVLWSDVPNASEFIVETRRFGSPTWGAPQSFVSGMTSGLITGLIPATPYVFRIKARNQDTESTWSVTLRADTTP